MPVVKIFVAAVLVLASASPVAAQTSESPAAISVEAGLGGYTAPDQPSQLAVTIASPVLISGRIRVTGSGIAVSRPIEVPADSEQRYDLTLPPLADGTRLTIEVVAGDGDRIARESVTIRPPGQSERSE